MHPGGPTGRLRLFQGSRPLKRWRYVAIFGEQLMACAALVQIGPLRQSFWALSADADEGRLRERTRLLPRRGEVELLPGASWENGAHSSERPSPEGRASQGCMRVREGAVTLDLLLEEEAGVQALCPHGRGEVWTRKQAGIRAHGTLALDGGQARAIEALAVIDDTAGYHSRRTEWRWSAGIGVAPDGTPLAWNLVSGVNDPPLGSERAVWVAGEPHEVPPVSFAADLSSTHCEDGSTLHFDPETERNRCDNLIILSSEYRALFGRFSGALPGGIALAHGRGVVEHHRARW